VYPFLTSGHTVDIKNATNAIAYPNVKNNTNKIRNGVFVNKSKPSKPPVINIITVNDATKTAYVMAQDAQYEKWERPITTKP
jgi:hypothetical protein